MNISFIIKTPFFSQGLGWLNLLVKGSVSASGKESVSDSPLQVGKWLPNSVSRLRRFYKHGTKEHMTILPSEKAKKLLKQEVQDGYESSPTFVPASFFKTESESISLLREVLSTLNNLESIVRNDSQTSNLSAASKAAIISAELALKDTMAITCQLQANVTLLHRDKFLYKIQPQFINSRAGILDEIRTAPFAGPLVPDSVVSSFDDLSKSNVLNQGSISYSRNESRFKASYGSFSQRQGNWGVSPYSREQSNSPRGFRSRGSSIGGQRFGSQRIRRRGGRFI